MRLHPRWFGSVVLLALCTAHLGAQGTSGGVLRGRITVEGDTTPIPGAEVELLGTTLMKGTDSNGRYQFLSVPAGLYTLRVRLPGYVPVAQVFTIEDDQWVDQSLSLKRLPQSLTTVRVEGKVLKVPPRYEEVYARAARGWGTFITRDDIVRRNPIDMVSLLETLPAVQVNDRGVTFARCKEFTNLALPTKGQSGAAPGAHVQLYVDGVRRTGVGISLRNPSDANGGGIAGDEVTETLKELSPSSIQAIEIYNGVSRIPAEFLEDACAVIAVWTRSY
jgi:hypothetical protein